jgi:predicted transposase/invertase (TIGR01784 family)
MNNIINPRVGIIFKKIFGSDKNKDILISFVNSIICKEDQINEIELLNPYNENDFKKNNLAVLYLRAKNKQNSNLLIELQLVDEKKYLKKGICSWANAHYSNQLISDKLNKDINRVVVIHILNFTLIDSSKMKRWKIPYVPKYHHEFALRDRETGIEIFRDFEIHTIELKKFAINATDLEGVIINIDQVLDKWIAFLTKYDLLKLRNLPEELNVPEIKKALKILKEMHLSKNELEIYNSQLSAIRKFAEEDKNQKNNKDKKTSIFKLVTSSAKSLIDFTRASFVFLFKFK